MASVWNLWVWLESIGVVSGCCCKEVYPHNNYYFSLIHSFFGSSIPTSLFIFYVFLFFLLFLCNIANVVQRTFKIV